MTEKIDVSKDVTLNAEELEQVKGGYTYKLKDLIVSSVKKSEK